MGSTVGVGFSGVTEAPNASSLGVGFNGTIEPLNPYSLGVGSSLVNTILNASTIGLPSGLTAKAPLESRGIDATTGQCRTVLETDNVTDTSENDQFQELKDARGSKDGVDERLAVSFTVNGLLKALSSGSPALEVNDTGLGAFNAPPLAKPTITGAKNSNTALASLLTALANLGLLTDNTTT